MNYFKKQWNLFLNKAIPGRREKLIKDIMKADQDNNLYECCGDWDEFGKCTCLKQNENDSNGE